MSEIIVPDPDIVVAGSDHAGFNLKNDLLKWLTKNRYETIDMGPYSIANDTKCDYPEYADRALNIFSELYANGRNARCMLICGSGEGMNMYGNHAGIRTAYCNSIELAEFAVKHNFANVIALGERVKKYDLPEEILRTFLESQFEGLSREGIRHIRRIVQMAMLKKKIPPTYLSMLGYEPAFLKNINNLADLTEYKHTLELIDRGCIPHVDVMTHPFIENIEKFPLHIIEALLKQLEIDRHREKIDIHLMVDDPSEWIHQFKKKGILKPGDNITMHREAGEFTDKNKIRKTLEQIKEYGYEACIALNPDTPVEELDGIYDAIDMALLMSVYPGKGGQRFIPQILKKIRKLHYYHPGTEIQIDGGLDDFIYLHCCLEALIHAVFGNYLTTNSSIENLLECFNTLKIKDW